ncbi:MAG: DUF1759 domain-containing protein, partial [Sulfitobacter sp.]|nr:DUF1759 domain-containing protein [Sulfitobacter sp.]
MIKPPRLPVPKFGGNLLEYSQWTSLFRVALESGPFSEEQKLILLNEALIGDAKEAVAGLLSGGASFRKCMDLLKAQFGDQERRIRAVADAMKNWPKMSSFRAPDVRQHRARCTKYLAMLDKFTPEEVRDAFLLMMMEDPIPAVRSSEWRMIIPNGTSATKEIFLEYLDKYALAHEDPGAQITKFEANAPQSGRAPLTKSGSAPPATRRPLLAFPPRRNTTLVAAAFDENGGEPLLLEEEDLDWALGEPEQAVLAMAGLDGPISPPELVPPVSSKPDPPPPTKCPICGHPHPLNHCKGYLQMKNRERWDLVFKKGLCSLCLAPGHRHANCSRPKCQKCQAAHHTSLHFWTRPSEPVRRADAPPSLAALAMEGVEPPSGVPSGDPACQSTEPTLCAMARVTPRTTREMVILMTALVDLVGPGGNTCTVRVLIDCGSQRNFISDRIRLQLGLPTICTEPLSIGLLGGRVTPTELVPAVVFRAKSRVSDFALNMCALAINDITTHPPPVLEAASNWEHLRGLTLADPTGMGEQKIDAIFGAVVFADLLNGSVVRPAKGERAPAAFGTGFGWVLCGPAPARRRDPAYEDPASFASCFLAQVLGGPALLRTVERRGKAAAPMDPGSSDKIPNVQWRPPAD